MDVKAERIQQRSHTRKQGDTKAGSPAGPFSLKLLDNVRASLVGAGAEAAGSVANVTRRTPVPGLPPDLSASLLM